MKILKYRIIAILVIVVASLQLFEVNENLTRWKGGGFGMYSEHHFFDNEIWINETNGDFLDNDELENLILTLKRQPNEYNSVELIKKMNLQKDTVLLQVWKPKLEIPELEFRRKLIYEITYISN